MPLKCQLNNHKLLLDGFLHGIRIDVLHVSIEIRPRLLSCFRDASVNLHLLQYMCLFSRSVAPHVEHPRSEPP